MIFKNPQFKERDYECTNIVACVADSKELLKKPNLDWDRSDWVESGEEVLEGLRSLGVENGVRFYGYL
jgi:hypothetical protein